MRKCRGWKWVVLGMAGAAIVLAPLGCRKAEEAPEPKEAVLSKAEGRGAAKPRVPTPASARSEAPAKLPRGEGRTPDGRKAPAAERVGVPIPGKPGFIFNPYNNNPVDVRGIPPGTLVMDPQDPDKTHRFRVPKASKPKTPEGEPGEGK